MKSFLFIVFMLFLVLMLWNPPIENVHQYIPENAPKELVRLVPQSVNFIDALFGFCVWVLIEIGRLFGVSYNEANIWVFVFIGPAVFILQTIYIIHLRKKLNS